MELTNRAIANRHVSIPLERLLRGQVPTDVNLRVFYYPLDVHEPQELPLTYNPVSYTHLDVYKRQIYRHA